MALLELQKLSKSFGGLKAVNELDLSIDRDEIVGLIGPNGAGKTTVFNMISGVFKPTMGKVLFKNDDITGFKPHCIVNKGLARTFQLTTLFSNLTVLENILLGFHLKSQIGYRRALFGIVSNRARYKQILDSAVGLADFMGIGNKRNELAKNLSHGHCRVLEVAIALATGPELLLLDEPVTGMSAIESQEMMNKIREINKKGISILLVEHHMKVVMDVCEKICVLDFGIKIGEGSPNEICNNQRVIKAYLGEMYAIRSPGHKSKL
jgi:branched-chain amino acid transport system ATP-binding protein